MPPPLTVELPELCHSNRFPGLAGGMQSLPMRGLTVLAVEDSRFAAEALRLMCQRSGARLRRAETLAAAKSHLRLYRPDLVIVDLGLPDGRGEVLIRDLVLRAPRPPVIFGTSGNPSGRATALAAGADGFLDKPLESLQAFQNALLRHLPDLAIPMPDDTALTPDPLALHDDLTRAAAVLDADPDAATRRYVAGFLSGVARHAHDPALQEAADRAGTAPLDGTFHALRGMLQRRLAAPDGAFRAARP